MMRPWVNILTGAWAARSSFWEYAAHPLYFFIIGSIVMVCGFWTYRREWQGMVNGSIGVWLMLSAFIPGMTVPWNLLASGLVIMCLATWRLIIIKKYFSPTV